MILALRVLLVLALRIRLRCVVLRLNGTRDPCWGPLLLCVLGIGSVGLLWRGEKIYFPFEINLLIIYS